MQYVGLHSGARSDQPYPAGWHVQLITAELLGFTHWTDRSPGEEGRVYVWGKLTEQPGWWRIEDVLKKAATG